jgi:hypothetical protein
VRPDEGPLIVPQTARFFQEDSFMSRTTWLRKRPRPKRPPDQVRLYVEQLETRNLLSTLLPIVTVAPADPFAGNTADNVSGQVGTNFPDTQVEPSLAVDPSNPMHLVAAWQQDRWSNGGARGLVSAVSFDGGNSWTSARYRVSV